MFWVLLAVGVVVVLWLILRARATPAQLGTRDGTIWGGHVGDPTETEAWDGAGRAFMLRVGRYQLSHDEQNMKEYASAFVAAALTRRSNPK